MEHTEIPVLRAARALPRHTQYRLLGGLLVVMILIVLLVMLVHHMLTPVEKAPSALPPGTFRPTASQLASFQIRTVGLGSSMDETSATGTITVDADRSTPVLMPYSGQVSEVLVAAGQRVVKGQPLLRIRTGDFVDARNALFSATAQSLSAQAQLRTAERNAVRQEEIYKTAGGAQKDYQQAQADLAAARSAARIAQAAVGAARDKLAILGKTPVEISRLENVGEVSGIHDQTTLHAPISGVIATRDVSPGQYVGVGGDKPVMTIADPGRVWLIAQVAESNASSVHVGDPVEVTTPAYPGRQFHAVIDNVGAGLDPETHRLPVRATIENSDLALKPQMFASFTIRKPQGSTAILVPAAAVIHEGESARIWVVRPDGLLGARTVTTADTGGGMVRIVSGLRTGERIVTSGAIFVNEAGLGE